MTLADVKAQAEPEKTSPPEETVAEPMVETPEAKPEVDYKSELERYKQKAERERELRIYEREERKKLQNAMRHEREQVSVAPQEESTDIDSLVDRKLEAVRREQALDLIEDTLSELSSNEHEQALVRAIYENDLKPSGWSRKAVREDLEKAFLIANRDRFRIKAEADAQAKIRRMKAEEVAASHGAQGGVGRTPPGASPGYSAEEQKWLGRVGKTKVDGE